MNLAEKIRALFTTYVGTFQTALSEAVPNTDGLILEVPSTSSSNTYGWLSQLPDFRRFGSTRFINMLKSNGYVIPNMSFELTIGIDKPDVEDDNLGIYGPLVSEMAKKAASHNSRLAYGALLRGLTADAQGKCLDGLSFFNDAHPLEFNADGTPITGVGAATFSNKLWDDNAPANAPIWFLAANGGFIKPVVVQPRKAPVFVSRTALTDENVFTTNTFQFGVDKRTGVGFGLPQLCIASNLPFTTANYETAREMLRDMVGYDEQLPLDLEPTHLYTGTSIEQAAKKLFSASVIDATDNIYKDDVKVVGTAYLNIRTTIANAASRAAKLD